MSLLTDYTLEDLTLELATGLKYSSVIVYRFHHCLLLSCPPTETGFKDHLCRMVGNNDLERKIYI